MNILAINTASLISRIALVGDGNVISENSWESNNDESEKLIVEIQGLLNKNNLKFENIDKILVVTGPGPFTALRVSIALANSLAYGLNKPIIGLSVMDLWEILHKDNFVINAGQNRVYFKGEIIDFDDFIKKALKFNDISGELKKEQMEMLNKNGIKWKNPDELISFGNVVLSLAKNGFKGYDEKEFVEPLYFSGPQITKSSKSYK